MPTACTRHLFWVLLCILAGRAPTHSIPTTFRSPFESARPSLNRPYPRGGDKLSPAAFAHSGVDRKGNHWPLCGQSGVCAHRIHAPGREAASAEAAAQKRAGSGAARSCHRGLLAARARGCTGREPERQAPHAGPGCWLSTTGAYAVCPCHGMKAAQESPWDRLRRCPHWAPHAPRRARPAGAQQRREKALKF